MSRIKYALVGIAALSLFAAAARPCHAQSLAPTRVPFHRSVSFQIKEGHDSNSRNFDMNVEVGGDETSADPQCGTFGCEYRWSPVPAGKRVVIEQVSATAKLPTGQMVEIDVTTWLKTTLDGVQHTSAVVHPFTPPNRVIGSREWHVLNQVTKFYASGNYSIQAKVTRGGTMGVADVRVNLSGYYEDEQ